MDTLCKKNFMFLDHTVFEKNAMIALKIQTCTIVLINNFDIFQVSIAFFFYSVRPRNLKFFCILTRMDTPCKKNFMFLGGTVFKKNAMIYYNNSKMHNCPNKQL